jgi:hypothetical protein
MSITEMQQQLEKLRAVRARGTRKVRFGEDEV